MGVIVIGITFASTASIEKDVRMEPGQSVDVGEYTFRFEGVEKVRGVNYQAIEGTIVATRAGKEIATLKPQKRYYPMQEKPMTEAAINEGLFRDLFVAMGDPLDSGAWSIRVQYKSFLAWIWMGAIFMALGGFLAIGDRRYRRISQRQVELDRSFDAQPKINSEPDFT